MSWSLCWPYACMFTFCSSRFKILSWMRAVLFGCGTPWRSFHCFLDRFLLLNLIVTFYPCVVSFKLLFENRTFVGFRFHTHALIMLEPVK